MSAPLDFLKIFAGQLRQGGIRFAITSGMACVHYGLHQTTKHSAWIIAPDDLAKLRDLLASLEQAAPPWRVSYRQICGAPLDAEFMAHGWTSHLLLTDPDGVEHKVDLFGKAPRVRQVALEPEFPDFADRDVGAQMKRTDRPKDWPIVDSLGWQLTGRSRHQSLVHLQDADKLLSVWPQSDAKARDIAIRRRPLLRLLESENDPDRLDGFQRLERLVWECVNSERHGLYARAEGLLSLLAKGSRFHMAVPRVLYPATSSTAPRRAQPWTAAQPGWHGRARGHRGAGLGSRDGQSPDHARNPGLDSTAARGNAPMKIVPVEPEPEYSEEYYEHLARTMGDEKAAWARLPRVEREKELRWYHEHFNTPDDLAEWPPELDGGVWNP